MSGFKAEWLALREPYDFAARNPAVLDAVIASVAGKPSVAIVDLALAGGDWLRLLRTVRERSPASKVIVLSLYDEMSVARAAMATGVDGFVLKRAIATDMLDAVAAVVSGQTYISPGISAWPPA